MNIIVRDTQGRIYCRPDTTLEREDKEFFVPDEVSAFLYCPVLFLKISKAGKHVGEKFAGRYYESIGWGILLYEEQLMGEGIAFAGCSDRTSILPGPLYTKHTLESEGNGYVLSKNDAEVFKCKAGDIDPVMIDKAIAAASAKVSLRIGDYLALELAAPAPLVAREEGKATLKGSWCENELFEVPVIF